MSSAANMLALSPPAIVVETFVPLLGTTEKKSLVATVGSSNCATEVVKPMAPPAPSKDSRAISVGTAMSSGDENNAASAAKTASVRARMVFIGCAGERIGGELEAAGADAADG